MKDRGLNDEYRLINETELRENERFQQAYAEYEAQLRVVPLRVNFETDEDYESALSDWDEIVDELLDRAKSLQRVS